MTAHTLPATITTDRVLAELHRGSDEPLDYRPYSIGPHSRSPLAVAFRRCLGLPAYPRQPRCQLGRVRARARGRAPRRHTATRSSARSGDSGDDEPGPAEPPPPDIERCPRCGRPLLYVADTLRCCRVGCGIVRDPRWTS
jgi:hypothetical protein